MAYDYSGSWDTITGHNANLFPSTSNPPSTPFNTDIAISAYIAAGIPRSKINLGMPLYGRSFLGTDGPGTAFESVDYEGSFEPGVWDYKALPKAGADVVDAGDVGASFSYDPAKREVISFDSVGVTRRKGDYVKDTGLGGGMWWESSGDRKVGEGGSLIETVRLVSFLLFSNSTSAVSCCGFLFLRGVGVWVDVGLMRVVVACRHLWRRRRPRQIREPP